MSNETVTSEAVDEVEMDDMEMDMDYEDGYEDGDEEEEEEETEESFVREYTETAPAAVTSEEGAVNKLSTVANKNPLSANKAKPASSSGSPTNTGAKQISAKVDDAGNINKPGAKVKQVAAPKPKAKA